MAAQQIEPLYVFSVWMLGAREPAFEAVCAAMDQAPGDPTRQLQILVATLTAVEKSVQVNRFDELDNILRTDSTVPIDLDHPLVQGDATRLQILLLELQRTCLMTTLRGLPAHRRAVFILLHVLGLSIQACVSACASTETAIRAAESRARKSLEGYLTTRCEHMDKGNPCHCAARVGGALERGFITWPEHGEHANAGPQDLHRRVSDLYASLPRVRLPVLQQV